MKQTLTLALTIAAILSGCCREHGQITSVYFPEPPVEILTNEDVGMDIINYFNIIQLPGGGYRMYFSGWKGETYTDDNFEIGQHLYYAESEDG